LANPLAGAAAFGALGLGLASHAFGIWLGAMTSAAEASQSLFFDPFDARPQRPRRRAVELRLVETPASEAAAAAARTAQADVEIAAREVVRTAKKTAQEAIDGTAIVAKAAARPLRAGSAPAQPRSVERPVRPNDLKAISGVGPKLEKVLNGYGISTYAQIAALTAEEIDRIEDELGFKGRIERDDWIGQAKALSGKAYEAGGSAGGK
jgi:NADH-quinone oxidoreductase subunit E